MILVAEAVFGSGRPAGRRAMFLSDTPSMIEYASHLEKDEGHTRSKSAALEKSIDVPRSYKVQATAQHAVRIYLLHERGGSEPQDVEIK